MGRDKALLPLGNATVIEWVVAVLKEVFEHIHIIADRNEQYRFLRVPIYNDLYKEAGPLAGIHSALRNSPGDRCFIASCDIPFITAEFVRHLVKECGDADACIPSIHGKLHPLCGVYRRSCIHRIEEHLDRCQFKLQDVLAKINTRVIEITPDLPFYTKMLLINLNNEQEYQEAIEASGNAIKSSSLKP